MKARGQVKKKLCAFDQKEEDIKVITSLPHYI